jgi:hypothetical protein
MTMYIFAVVVSLESDVGIDKTIVYRAAKWLHLKNMTLSQWLEFLVELGPGQPSVRQRVVYICSSHKYK